jgi:hypothetical protein
VTKTYQLMARRLCRNLHKEVLNPLDGSSTAHLLAFPAILHRPPRGPFSALPPRTPQNPLRLASPPHNEAWHLAAALSWPSIPRPAPQPHKTSSWPLSTPWCIGCGAETSRPYPHTQPPETFLPTRARPRVLSFRSAPFGGASRSCPGPCATSRSVRRGAPRGPQRGAVVCNEPATRHTNPNNPAPLRPDARILCPCFMARGTIAPRSRALRTSPRSIAARGCFRDRGWGGVALPPGALGFFSSVGPAHRRPAKTARRGQWPRTPKMALAGRAGAEPGSLLRSIAAQLSGRWAGPQRNASAISAGINAKTASQKRTAIVTSSRRVPLAPRPTLPVVR